MFLIVLAAIGKWKEKQHEVIDEQQVQLCD
jgi:hypothetical protein